jgi:hypothetical protein
VVSRMRSNPGRRISSTSHWFLLLLTCPPAERRNVAARERLQRRIRSEFEEMPGLSLTSVQARTLFGISPDASSRILLRPTEEGVLLV